MRILFVILLSLIFSTGYCQYSNDQKIIINYSAKYFDSQPQNWYVDQDSSGILFFANTQGIIIFDGSTFKRLYIPGNVVRSIFISKNQNVFVGGKNQFGYLNKTKTGFYEYISLSEKFNLEKLKFNNIFQIAEFNNFIHFRSSNYLFSYKDSVKVTKGSFGRMDNCNDKLFFQINNKGLMEFDGRNLQFIKNGDKFKDMNVKSIQKVKSNSFFVADKYKGLFRYNGSLTKISSDGSDYLEKNIVTNGTKISADEFAFSTKLGGVVVLNEKGNIQNVFDKKYGIQSNDVKYIHKDKSGNLWFALNEGISKIEFNSPFSVYEKSNKIDGIVLAIQKHKGNLFIGTSTGLFKLRESVFYKVDKIQNSVWSLLSDNDKLFIGTSSGITILGSKPNIFINESVYSITKTKKNNEYLLSTKSGPKLLKKDKHWEIQIFNNNLNADVRTSTVDSQNNYWFGSISNGVLKIKADENKNWIAEKFDSTNNLSNGSVHISNFNGEPIFATQKGIYTFDKNSNSFSQFNKMPESFPKDQTVFAITSDLDGDIWFNSKKMNYGIRKNNDGSYYLLSKIFKRLDRKQINIIYPDNNLIWFGGYNQLIKYNKNINKEYLKNYSTLVRKVWINSDSLIYDGVPIEQINNYKIPKLDFEERNIRFEYAATFYEAEDRTTFQYKLDGYNEKWSEWTNEIRKDYTNLSEGKYTFNVRAKNVYDDISQIGQFKFVILPPFYRTYWAYLFYILSVVGMGFIIVKWRIKKLEQEKKNLKILIDEKTKEIKNQNYQLAEQTEKLKELDKVKSRFFANISHEFRTPLTLIIGPAEQLLNEEKDKVKKNKFSLIHKNSKRLLGLINQLLDLSKLENGKIELKRENIDLKNLINEIVGLFHSLAEGKKITLSVLAKDDPIIINCDKEKIEKVVINLVSNALKFTKENGEVNVILDCKEFQKVIIKIKDTGIGIDKSELDKIFTPFYQVDDSEVREFEGTGIGLALVKEYIELHSGQISVTSKINEGTEFIIELPSINVSDNIVEHKIGNHIAEIVVDETVSNNSDESELDQKWDSILIVEDNLDVRNYIKDSLKNDYKICEASNGEEGFIKAKENIPDLIISDVMMPIMDGFEFCEKIKTDINTCHIPVIILTAKAGDENIIQGLETGADDYITKPFNIQILQTRVKNLIELRKQIQSKFKNDFLLRPSEIKVSSMDDEFLAKLKSIIEKNIANPDFNIDSLIDEFFMSRTSLYRKVKALTGESPNQFLRSFRLKRAAQLLKQKSANITEISYSVGFNNSAYFTKCFKEHFGQLPSDL